MLTRALSGSDNGSCEMEMKLIGNNAQWAVDTSYWGANKLPFTKIKALYAKTSGLSNLQVLVDNVNVWSNGMTWDTDYDVSNANRVVITITGASSPYLGFMIH